MKPKNLIKRGETYHFRGTVDGKAIWQTLETSDRQVAEARAGALKAELKARRWDTLMGVKRRNSWSTLGEVFDAYRRHAATQDINARTIGANISCLCRILRTVHGMHCNPEAKKTSILTADLVRDYQARKLQSAKPSGPLALDRAKSTSFSTVRQARSIFSRECLQSSTYRGLLLPDLSGFLETRLKNKERRLRRPPDPKLIEATAKAATELKKTHPAHWLAFILCSNLGLRRSEAIAACWNWVEEISLHGEKTQTNGTRDTVETTCYVMSVIKRDDFDPKGSPRLISIHPEVWKNMLSVQSSIGTIIPGTPNQRLQACKDNVAWLRSLGWDARLPNHALRGLFASTIASQHGLFAAQSALGHADPRTTTDSYAAWLGLDKVVKVF